MMEARVVMAPIVSRLKLFIEHNSFIWSEQQDWSGFIHLTVKEKDSEVMSNLEKSLFLEYDDNDEEEKNIRVTTDWRRPKENEILTMFTHHKLSSFTYEGKNHYGLSMRVVSTEGEEDVGLLKYYFKTLFLNENEQYNGTYISNRDQYIANDEGQEQEFGNTLSDFLTNLLNEFFRVRNIINGPRKYKKQKNVMISLMTNAW